MTHRVTVRTGNLVVLMYFCGQLDIDMSTDSFRRPLESEGVTWRESQRTHQGTHTHTHALWSTPLSWLMSFVKRWKIWKQKWTRTAVLNHMNAELKYWNWTPTLVLLGHIATTCHSLVKQQHKRSYTRRHSYSPILVDYWIRPYTNNFVMMKVIVAKYRPANGNSQLRWYKQVWLLSFSLS